MEGIHPGKNLSKKNHEHVIYPYLLRGKTIDHCNQVWSTDITYIRLKKGFVYLIAIIDWYSRFVLDWQVSTTLEADFCIDILERVLQTQPVQCDIFNTDQGSQFKSEGFVNVLKNYKIQISMDGRERALDNIFVERLWRSVKYECIYLKKFVTVLSVEDALWEYFLYYNHERPHQSLGYQTPAVVYLTQIKRFIFTGTPGSGKTSAIKELEKLGYVFIHEAATDVISQEQVKGIEKPWEEPDFVDQITYMQKGLQMDATGDLQFYDRSPFCTYALGKYLSRHNNIEFRPSLVLLDEIDRCLKDRIYQNKVFFFENFGFIEHTDARKISYEDAMVFEQIHLDAYKEFGFDIIMIPKWLTVTQRCEFM